MGNAVIMAENLSKKYKLYTDRPFSLKDIITRTYRRGYNEFWALRDISFSVPSGTALGILGRNGSGKSTLLKLMSRIIHPTSGQITIHGRMSTLLEVGAGFHPDFTGRENIYLNASTFGVGRGEIKDRIEEIIEFAEIRKHIDSPIRNYSTGMYTRLGFAVAVHINPDILLVDEVLAVGDLAFQEKCLDRMHQLKQNGTTIVLVTHAPEQVRAFCDRAMWLHYGDMKAFGEANHVASLYEEDFHS